MLSFFWFLIKETKLINENSRYINMTLSELIKEYQTNEINVKNNLTKEFNSFRE